MKLFFRIILYCMIFSFFPLLIRIGTAQVLHIHKRGVSLYNIKLAEMKQGGKKEKLSAINKCDEYAEKGENALSQSEKYANSSGWGDKFTGAGHAGTAESFFKLIMLKLKLNPASCVTTSLRYTFCDDYSINFTKAELKAEEARKNNSKSGKLIFSAQTLAYSQKYEICLFMDDMD